MDNPFLDKENEDIIQFLLEDVFQRSDLDIQILSGDASTRRYFRVLSHTTPFQPVIIMVSGKEDLQDVLSHVECCAFFKRIGFCIPELFESAAESGYLIEEDLGDISLEIVVNSGEHTSDSQKYYSAAIDQIVLLQNSFDDPDVVREFSHALPLRNRFTEQKFFEELKMFYDYFFVRYLNMDIPEREDIEALFYRISEDILMQGLVPTHRDFHSRNLFIKTGRLYVLDFQDARMGPPLYDLVSLVFDPYVRLPARTREALVQEYLRKVYLRTSSSFRKTFDEMFVLCAIQRLLKAVGTYSYMYMARHNSFYLQFITNALRDVDKLMEGRKEFDIIRPFLQRAMKKDWGEVK
jgi:N-acetylmuramate 1-kinase